MSGVKSGRNELMVYVPDGKAVYQSKEYLRVRPPLLVILLSVFVMDPRISWIPVSAPKGRLGRESPSFRICGAGRHIGGESTGIP